MHGEFLGERNRSILRGQTHRQRVWRGGSFDNNDNNARAAYRNRNNPNNRNNNIGFRVALTYFGFQKCRAPLWFTAAKEIWREIILAASERTGQIATASHPACGLVWGSVRAAVRPPDDLWQ